MVTDTEIKIKGFEALLKISSKIEAERFISLIMGEPFDYTRWQRNLWSNKPVEEISAAAMQFRKKSKMEEERK